MPRPALPRGPPGVVCADSTVFANPYSGISNREWPKALLLASFFFLVIATFWVVKPIKRSVLINHFAGEPIGVFGLTLGGAEAEQVAKILNMAAALVVALAFAWLAHRYTRQSLVLIWAAFYAVAFAAYSAVVENPGEFVAWSFYVTGDMFNTTMVALFWAYTADLTPPLEARRLYGIIGLGGVLGGFAGATVVSSTVEQVGRSPLLLACIVPLGLICLIAFQTAKYGSGAHRVEAPSVVWRAGTALDGARLVFRSRYLLAIAGLIGCYEIVSNLVDFQLAFTVEHAIHGSLEKDAFFGLLGQVTAAASIMFQLLVTGFVLRNFEIESALYVLPVVLIGSSIGFLVAPALLSAAVMSASDNALNYSINQSAREALYTPAPADVKYKAKAFIDMFLQRSAKVAAALLSIGFATLSASGVRWLSLVTLSVLALWLALISRAGSGFREREARVEWHSAGNEGNIAGGRPNPSPSF